MSSFIQKIRKASHQRSIFKFTPQHLQSAEFMQNNVIYSKYVVPTDHFKITPVFEGRCAALTNPSFINTEYHIRAFYVPHNLVWRRFDDWVNGNATLINGQHYFSDVPYITDKGLSNLIINFCTQTNLTETDVKNTALYHTYDFISTLTHQGTNSYIGYKLNYKGRFIYKLLISLGYKFNFTLDDSKSDQMNALALLSYFRVHLDYFIPSLHYNTSACHLLLSKVYDSGQTLDLSASSVDLRLCLEEIFECYYPSNYITASWQQPQSPLGSNLDNAFSQSGQLSELSQMAITDVSGNSSSAVANTTVNGVQSTQINNSTNLAFGNPWIQRNLQKIADWLTRTRFAGTDKLINILSRFGVKPDNVLSLRSKMVGHFTQPLLVQDINATATTYASNPDDNVVVGDYAGKMFSNAQSNQTFDFKCDDYGVIIITSMISPHEIHYFEGIDRDICKVKPLQFYQPEFDSMGTQLQSRRELISGITFDLPQTAINNWTFQNSEGYVPRYSEYKQHLSTISGDFAVNSLNEGQSSFHHMRSFFKYGRYEESQGTYVNNSLVPNTGAIDDVQAVNLGSAPTLLGAQTNLLQRAIDKQQYNRIFNVASNVQDHIYTMYYFNIIASRPMCSIADSIDIEDGTNEKIDVSKDTIENFK